MTDVVSESQPALQRGAFDKYQRALWKLYCHLSPTIPVFFDQQMEANSDLEEADDRMSDAYIYSPGLVPC